MPDIQHTGGTTNPDPRPASVLEEMTKKQLQKMAEELNVPVQRVSGEEGSPLKSDYVRALRTSR